MATRAELRQVSHMSTGVQAPGLSSAAGMSAGSRTGSGATRMLIVSFSGCWHCMCQLYPLYHNAHPYVSLLCVQNIQDLLLFWNKQQNIANYGHPTVLDNIQVYSSYSTAFLHSWTNLFLLFQGSRSKNFFYTSTRLTFLIITNEWEQVLYISVPGLFHLI